MSTAAVMVCRDEADIIGATVESACEQFDAVIVATHQSVDGTREILEGFGSDILLLTQEGRGLWGDKVWTRLSHIALEQGHDWAAVVDADEIWHHAVGTGRILDLLAELPDDVFTVRARILDHIATAFDDDSVLDPVRRMGWRHVESSGCKVAFRLRPDVAYRAHNAWYGGELLSITEGITVRHFSLRTAEQTLHKVRVGMDSHSVEAGLPYGFDEAWGQWMELTDAQVRDRFWREFFSEDPANDGRLIYDPAPVTTVV